MHVSDCAWTCACVSVDEPVSGVIFKAYSASIRCMIMCSKGQKSFLTSRLHNNEKGSDYENIPLLLPLTRVRRNWEGSDDSPPPSQYRPSEQPAGLAKDRDGGGKRIEMRSGWLEAAPDFHSVFEELISLTLSLTSVWRDGDESK